jgi:hypothetical protein
MMGSGDRPTLGVKIEEAPAGLMLWGWKKFLGMAHLFEDPGPVIGKSATPTLLMVVP